MPKREKYEHFDKSVFVNCPFDQEFKPHFRAIIFAVAACGFRPRCALEVEDGGEVRIKKILRIIDECRLGIHDLSRTELNHEGLPRFNMPLELGLFLGAKRFGTGRQKRKSCIIFERKRYQYHKYISDIAGQDIHSHDQNIETILTILRDWLSQFRRDLPGGGAIRAHYTEFQAELPEICRTIQIDVSELTFFDFSNIVSDWIERRPLARPIEV